MQIPNTVPAALHLEYEWANDIRLELKRIAGMAYALRETLIAYPGGTGSAPAEAIANAELAYRHIEDASMRLGKVLQALDGGVSVYDKATTVGA